MRLASIESERGRMAAVVHGGRAVALADVDPSLPRELTEIVRAWPAVHERLLAIDGAALERAGTPLDEVRLGIPFEPPRILGVGGNYADHLGEMAATRSPDPSAFLKLPDAAQGPDAPLRLGSEDRFVDYEGEIAMVVGAPARDLDADEAREHIAGLMLANDITARDVPTAHITLAKGQPGFCPLGPWLVTVDELDLDDVSFTVEVNGELRQAATSATMVHGFAAILAPYSRAIPLEPGDVILTGTPAGTGIGRRPPSFLRPGDDVHVRSPQLGSLRTPVIAARPSSRDGAGRG